MNIDNPTLYEKVKFIADNLYDKPSAYKSGFIVKTYKELIKGDANLPAFLPLKKVNPKKAELNGAGVYSLGQPADNISQYDEIYKWSNPKKVQELAKNYLGEGATIFRSIKKDKKYMIYNPNTKKWVHFGQMKFSDFTQHQDEERRKRYLARATKIKGDWKNNKYSPNNLSIHLLW